MRNIKNLNLTIDINTYYEAKRNIPRGQVSQLFSVFLKEYLKKQKRERLIASLIASYKKTAKSKAVKKEDKIWEDAIADGIK